MPPIIHLVDASPYIFRAYFSSPDTITDSQGRPVNAIYGFASFLVRYLREHHPSHIAVAFDESLTTSFRNEIYPPYKAQRELPPPDLVDQLRSCKDVARAMGTAPFADLRFEADDIIATLIERLREEDCSFTIVSPDKDLAQLVNDRITLFDFARDARLGPLEVLEKFGVRPHQIPDLLGLAGDRVDNIPGVRGIGPKTASALLEAFPSLEEIYDHLDQVESLPIRGAASLARKLAAHRAEALLSKALATVSREVPFEISLVEIEYGGPSREMIEELFDRFGFDTLRDRVLALA